MENELERKVSCVWSENLSIIFDFKPRLVFAAEMIFPSSRQGKNFWNVGQRIFKDKVMLRSSHRGSVSSLLNLLLWVRISQVLRGFSDKLRLSSLLIGPLALFSTQEDQPSYFWWSEPKSCWQVNPQQTQLRNEGKENIEWVISITMTSSDNPLCFLSKLAATQNFPLFSFFKTEWASHSNQISEEWNSIWWFYSSFGQFKLINLLPWALISLLVWIFRSIVFFPGMESFSSCLYYSRFCYVQSPI